MAPYVGETASIFSRRGGYSPRRSARKESSSLKTVMRTHGGSLLRTSRDRKRSSATSKCSQELSRAFSTLTNLPDVHNVAVIWLGSKLRVVRDHHFTTGVWRPRNVIHRFRRCLWILVDVQRAETEFPAAFGLYKIEDKHEKIEGGRKHVHVLFCFFTALT